MNNRLKKITFKNYILLAIKETNKKFIKNLRGSVIFKVQKAISRQLSLQCKFNSCPRLNYCNKKIYICNFVCIMHL